MFANAWNVGATEGIIDDVTEGSVDSDGTTEIDGSMVFLFFLFFFGALGFFGSLGAFETFFFPFFMFLVMERAVRCSSPFANAGGVVNPVAVQL